MYFLQGKQLLLQGKQLGALRTVNYPKPLQTSSKDFDQTAMLRLSRVFRIRILFHLKFSLTVYYRDRAHLIDFCNFYMIICLFRFACLHPKFVLKRGLFQLEFIETFPLGTEPSSVGHKMNFNQRCFFEGVSTPLYKYEYVQVFYCRAH